MFTIGLSRTFAILSHSQSLLRKVGHSLNGGISEKVVALCIEGDERANDGWDSARVGTFSTWFWRTMWTASEKGGVDHQLVLLGW